MIAVGRAIEGISLNGKEYLRHNQGTIMAFPSREDAREFLRENGFHLLSNEEIEESFFFEELDDFSEFDNHFNSRK